MNKLFVYGTLRKGASANTLMHKHNLLKSCYTAVGYQLYDCGEYPFVIYTGDDADHIIGDLYEVGSTNFIELDEYEGPTYKRVFDRKHDFEIYVKTDLEIDGYEKIQSGNWLRK